MESFQVGIQTTIIGLGIVFGVLVILAIFTWLLSKIIDGSIARKEEKQKATVMAQQPAASVETAKPVVAAAPQATGISPKTVAAIMAAVSAASGVPVANLKFSAIRRGSSHSDPWSASGTADIMTTRQNYL